MNKILFSLSLGVISSILALPSGHSVKGGSAKVVSQGDQVVITSGKSAVIHWDQFSVGKGETAKFQMQDSKSSVLNRVTGGNKSEILGRMESNGKVYLLNPKGVLFGKDCEINVGGLVASTLDALDADYIKGGKLLFDGDSNASIVNLGKISSVGGDVYLLAQKVENSGSIEASHVGLASGSKILIKPEGNERIFVKAGNGSVDHSGNIKAAVAELKTKSAYEMAINCTGTIEGVRTENVNGRIFLSADGGKAVVNSKLYAEGGQISVLGEEITLAENAHLDVSDMNGLGGRIDVGVSKEVHSIFVNEGARLDASGKPGGKIYLLAGEVQFFGGIKARGLENFDGGFAEISSVSEGYTIGHDFTCYDLSSDSGNPGEILFDPGTITIDVSATGGPCTFGDGFISPVLAGGTSVTITSAGQTAPSSIPCGGGGVLDIVFSGGPTISWGSDAVFTLTATRAIDSTGGLFTISNTSATTGGAPVIVLTGLGTPSLGPTENFIGVDLASGTISTVGRDISITGTGGNSGSFNVGVRIGTISSTTGNISVTGTSVGEATGLFNQGISIGGTTTTASGDMTFTGIGGDGIRGCVGVFIPASAGPTTTDGLITITGTGGGTDGGVTENHGVETSETSITSSGGIFSAGKGITITGTGGTGSSGENHGFTNSFGGVIPISTDANPILITGIGGSGGGTNRGISIENPIVIFSTDTGTTGTITLNGTGGTGAGSCEGVLLSSAFGGLVIDSNAAAISVTGLGGSTVTGTGNNGVQVGGGTDLISMTGAIAIDGTASSAVGVTDDNNGVLITDAATTVSSSGDVSIMGLGAGDGLSNMGVQIVSDASVSVSSIGELTIMGTGSSAGGFGDTNCDGIGVSSSTIASAAGDVTFTGTGGDSGDNCVGISFTTVDFDSAAGDVVFTGLGGGTNGAGVTLSGGTFNLAGGSLMMMGTGVGTGSSGMGINIIASSITSSGGSAPLTFMGTGTAFGFSEAFGIVLNAATAGIVSDGGKITMMGSGAGSAGGFGLSHGIGLIFGADGVTGTGSAEVEMTGIGGDGPSFCAGVAIRGFSRAITDSGDLSIDGTGGSTDSATNYGIYIENTAGGSPQVFSDSGTITLLGKEGGTDNRGILVTNRGAVDTVSSPVFVTTMSDLLIENGSGIFGGSGLLTFDIDRDLTITGNGFTSGIFPGTGGVTIATGRDLTLIGPDVGTGDGIAQIGHNSAAGVNSDIIFTFIGRNVLVDGFLASGGSNYSLIGHGGNGTLNGGAIRFLDVLGDVIVQGGDTVLGAVDGFGQIGHLTIFGETVSGDIAINARGDISVIGGLAAPSAYARIGHGGPAVGTVTSSSMTLIANDNIIMTSQAGAGQAIISNLSTSASDSLRLVVDNSNPITPAFGAATFSINSGSDLSMPNSSGEVRIYTVQPSQNTVGTTINGDVFTPTPLDVDDDNNQYGVYFPGGTFVGGAAFRVYYKTGTAVPVPNPAETILEFEEGSFYKLAVALSELQDRLPLFRYMRLANYPWHHPSFCSGKNACDPGFDPYQSFLFEDNVYWVGEHSREVQ